MDCTIRRVECLDVVETFWDCSHLYHTIAVVGIKSLDLGASGSWLAMPVQSSVRELNTCSGTRPGPGGNSARGFPWTIAHGARHRGEVALQTHS